MNFRQIKKDDYARVLEINRECVPAVGVLTMQDLENFQNTAYKFFVAETENKVVGYLLLFKRNADYDAEEFLYFKDRFEEDFLYVDQIALSANWRSKGIGKQFQEIALKSAKENNLKRILLEISLTPRNDLSFRFHEGLGFKQIGVMKLKNGKENGAMEKLVAE